MACDDLDIGPSSNGSLKVLKNGCAKSLAGFERPLIEPNPQIDGKDVSLDEAIAAAAKLIRESRLPVFGGLGTDVDGMRAVMPLAERSGGVVDHALSGDAYRNLRVYQSSGYLTTSLTEARNRADLFIIAGCDIGKIHPRFFERIVSPERSMFSDAPPKRTIIFLGEGLDQSAAKGERIGDVLTLPCKTNRIGEILDAMRALAKGAAISSDDIGGLPRSAVDDLLARCKAATYGVMVWVPSSFDFPDADLTVQAINAFIKDLNATQRFAGLSLGGSEGSTSVNAVCTWQSGFPLRLSFASGKTDYDSTRYDASRMIAAEETDLLIWLASYTDALNPPETDIPMIVLGTPHLSLKRTPKVFIPVGTPGIDHAGTIVRVDSVVSLPLRKLRESKLPSAANVIASIEAAL
jgi:formylmethanofuran dehydrogenase subunit B